LRLSRKTAESVLRELGTVAPRLLKAPRVLIHRDLQSSNVLVTASRRIAFIDFQGMRLGPAAYDLASLLCDPYVSLPIENQEDLLSHYENTTGGRRELRDLFWWAGVQRLTQALGAFGRLSAIRGAEHFGGRIPPAVRMLDRALQQTGGFPELRAVVRDALS
jgi:aminoglycoside/choline kinase family phosphotransferase